MLGFKSTVPVHFRIVEAEGTTGFMNLDMRVTFAREKFEVKGPILTLFAYLIDFIDYSANSWILVQEDLSNEIFEWKILLSEIQMC